MYVLSYFPFGFDGRMGDLIVSVPDHCLSFYLIAPNHWLSKARNPYARLRIHVPVYLNSIHVSEYAFRYTKIAAFAIAHMDS